MCLSEEHAARLEALGPSSKRAKKEATATDTDRGQFWAAGERRRRAEPQYWLSGCRSPLAFRS